LGRQRQRERAVPRREPAGSVEPSDCVEFVASTRRRFTRLESDTRQLGVRGT
jgi:hypothetical protein